MLTKVDLIEELRELQDRAATDELLVEAHSLLLDESNREASLLNRLRKAPGEKHINEGRIDPRRVFDLATIKEVAIRYRLRFLDTKYYKNEYPRGAISAIKQLEDGLGHDLTDFKILAPAYAFDLCDADADPLLFVPVGGERFYLIHKWGEDLNMVRRTLYWPLRRPRNLVFVLMLLSALLASIVPTALLTANPNADFFGIHRMLFFVWTSVVITSITVYAWFAFFGKFSTRAWNDHRFN